jgi:hypothetical protein
VVRRVIIGHGVWLSSCPTGRRIHEIQRIVAQLTTVTPTSDRGGVHRSARSSARSRVRPPRAVGGRRGCCWVTCEDEPRRCHRLHRRQHCAGRLIYVPECHEAPWRRLDTEGARESARRGGPSGRQLVTPTSRHPESVVWLAPPASSIATSIRATRRARPSGSFCSPRTSMTPPTTILTAISSLASPSSAPTR